MRLRRRGTGRWRLRFRAMMLERSDKLLALSVGVFVAALAGVTLGQSAVGAIHPLYFEGPAPPPRAVDARIRQPAAPAYYQAYDWQRGMEARAAACGDACDGSMPYDYVHAPEPLPRFASAEWREDSAGPELEPWPAGQVSSERRAALMRYADYPIEEKPAPARDKEEAGAAALSVDTFDE